MDRKKKIILICTCVVIFFLLLVRGVWIKVDKKENGGTESASVYERVTRAEAARLVSLLFYDRKELDALPREMIYTDTKKEDWYDRYINGLYELGLTGGDIEKTDEEFRPLDFLTEKELEGLLERICTQKEGMTPERIWEAAGLSAAGRREKAYVKRPELLALYEALMKELGEGSIEDRELFIYCTREQEPTLEEGTVITDAGRFYAEGQELSALVDRAFSVKVRGDAILYIGEEVSEHLFKNVWLEEKNKGGKELLVFYEGTGRTLNAENNLEKRVGGVVADLLMENGKIKTVYAKPELISGKVLRTGDDYVILETGEGEKKLSLSEDFKIYRIYGKLAIENAKGILVGYNNTDFVMDEGMICAALIKSSIQAKNIRVLLKTDNFQELFHEKAEFTSDSAFTVSWGAKKKEYKAGSRVTVKPQSKWLKEGHVTVKSKDPDGKIRLLSFQRNGTVPSYRGTLDISAWEDRLILVNELPLEEYLYGVVPSEMPSSYGVEALKVQAVCARSYAYNQLLSNSYGKYGAHVDDSVSYQVYNNLPENENTILAVKETYGQVLEYKNAVITAYYFSTSCGHTSSAGDVWPGTEEPPYLKGAWQNKTKVKGEKKADLSAEKNFRDFITQNPANTYDSSYAWYRWKTKIDAGDIKETVDERLAARYQANPALVLTKGENGTYESKPIETVGEVKNIEVVKRAGSGIAQEVVVTGSEKTVRLITEFNIRTLLAPKQAAITRQDESTVEKLSMLPSAYFIVERKEKEGNVSFLFTGGGYGHGVGMSQNGAKTMADEGHSYEDILKHYYPGIEIGSLY